MGSRNSALRLCCTRIKSCFTTNPDQSGAHKLSTLERIENIEKSDPIALNREKSHKASVQSQNFFLNFSYQPGLMIGSGPHGTVYEALCMETGEIVALKKVPCLVSERRKIYLYLEGKLMNLSHESLLRYVDIYESKENGTDLYIISRLISGCSLREALKNFPKFEETIVRIFCKEILSGLIYLKEAGIWHSNLNPNNVLIEASGKIKLSDFFTISKKLLEPRGRVSIIDFAYKSPEILLKQKKSIKGDVWALGCIVIEMVNSALTWPNDLKEITEKLKKNQGPEIPGNLSPECRDFLKKCLIIDESQRADPEELINHEFIMNEKETEEKDRIFIRGLSLYGSPLKKKSRFSISKGEKIAIEKNYEEQSSPIKVIGGRSLEESVNVKMKNELERKKYEAELLKMFNCE